MYPIVQRAMWMSPDTGGHSRLLNVLCRERSVHDSNVAGQAGALLEEWDMQNWNQIEFQVIELSSHLSALVSHDGVIFQHELLKRTNQVSHSVLCMDFTVLHLLCESALLGERVGQKGGGKGRPEEETHERHLKAWIPQVANLSWSQCQHIYLSAGCSFAGVSHWPVARWWDVCQLEQSQETLACACTLMSLIQERK